MRKVSILIAICMVAAVALTVYAQGQRDLQPIMKEVQPTNGLITATMKARTMTKEEIATNADKLSGLFKEVSSFMKSKNIDDAVTMATDASNAAADLSKAAKANDYDAMKTSSAAITKACATCHAAHREQDPATKAFKLKVK